MKNNRPQLWTAKSGTPAIDFTNDSQMVRENLRVPKLQKYIRAKLTDTEKAAIATEKAAFVRLKSKFPAMYTESRGAIIEAFLKSKFPKWGSFKFSGVQV